jgi:hypothetical protein
MMGYDAMSSPMDEFDSELRRAFASLEDPADDGFAAGVSRRVARGESQDRVRVWLNAAAFVVAGGAFAYGVFGIARAFAPSLTAEYGLRLAEAQGALANVNLAALAAGLLPLVLAGGAVIGGLAVARATD